MKSWTLFAAIIPLLVAAHKEPKTAAEIEVQRNLQAAAYHCAPAIAEFTAARQRSWAQKVLAGRPALPEYEDLFTAWDDVAPGREQKLLGCSPIEQTRIRNQSCVLAPEVTEGPYYHTVGHPIRQNIAENQFAGAQRARRYLDGQCDGPLRRTPGTRAHMLDEQPQVGGKRNGLLSAFPRTKPEQTWLRGAWPTNQNGVAQFTTIFPGYYTGRATHVHTKVFPEWKTLPNGTFESGRLSHVGQFFFDDDINVQIDKALRPSPLLDMWPYITNPIKDTRGRTRNWRDSLNIFEDSHGPEGQYNPVFDLHMLGGVINQGLIGYITMGVNMSASYDNWWKG